MEDPSHLERGVPDAPLAQEQAQEHPELDAGGHGATTKLAKCKLDNLGYIRGSLWYDERPLRLAKTRRLLETTYSLADISREKKVADAANKTTERTGLVGVADAAAARKLATKNGVKQLFLKKKIRSLLLRLFLIETPAFRQKPELLANLESDIAKEPFACQPMFVHFKLFTPPTAPYYHNPPFVSSKSSQKDPHQ